jgi:NAD(P)-dependent dehydrogenase (short-subunit alcohol dehydrogenase family)
MKEIGGKTAVVVAGGDGIGRGIALALADAGANVVVADIRADAAERVRGEVIGRGRRALAVRTDASRLEDMQALADAAYGEFGGVDILCNNAGVLVRPNRAIWDTSYVDLQYVVGVNTWGLLNGVHVFVPRMRAQPGEKHIVNTSSVGALYEVAGLTMYLMTKAATIAFSDNIREELRADGFGVTLLIPGVVNTNAVTNTALVRSPEARAAEAAAKPYSSYAQERGEVLVEVPGGRGAMAMNAADTGTLTPVEPDQVGRMVVAAIRANRSICMTHPAPRAAIERRAAALLDGYHPDD